MLSRERRDVPERFAFAEPPPLDGFSVGLGCFATVQTRMASVTAIFQFVARASASSDGRLMIGPANSSATAARGGPPPARRARASGISKKVGSAIGTAIEATTITANERKSFEARECFGKYSMSSIEQRTPIMRAGTVRITTSISD